MEPPLEDAVAVPDHDVDEESSDLSDDEYLDDSDDEFGDGADTGIPEFTFLDPLSSGVTDKPLSTIEQVAEMANFQGKPVDKNLQLRFIIGIKEFNRFPGKAPGEIDRFKRSWIKLMGFSRKFHWRRIFHNSFEGDYYHEAVPFSMDGVEWKTVTHFMLGMLYATTPDYAATYSLRARHLQVGWWGKVESALEESSKNIRMKTVLPDPNYEKFLDAYLQRALLAKFTQHPKLKQCLLLTEDAMFALREGPTRLADFPALGKVRDIIRQNPTMVYKGDSIPVTYDLPEIPVIGTSEELNFNYVDLQTIGGSADYQKLIANGLLGGSVHSQAIYAKPNIEEVIRSVSPNSILNQEPILTCDQVVYLAAGAYKLDVANVFNMTTLSFVRRHIYALERITDNKNERIMIAAQTTPCSQYGNYLHFYQNISVGIPPVSIYLEPLATSTTGSWDYGIQIIADRQDPSILTYLRGLIVQFVSPGTEEEVEIEEEILDEE